MTRVLVVEDDPDQLALLSAFLHRERCTVIAAPTAESALGLPADLVPDLMIVDLVLPGLDGWQLTTRLRERYPDCPVAVASVLDVADYPPGALTLPKPVTRADVAALVDGVRGRAARR
jgi:DNA-binding response OmpR family regulator